MSPKHQVANSNGNWLFNYPVNTFQYSSLGSAQASNSLPFHLRRVCFILFSYQNGLGWSLSHIFSLIVCFPLAQEFNRTTWKLLKYSIKTKGNQRAGLESVVWMWEKGDVFVSFRQDKTPEMHLKRRTGLFASWFQSMIIWACCFGPKAKQSIMVRSRW